MPEATWTEKMTSLLKGDYQFYDSHTLTHLQTELKKIPEESQEWVEFMMLNEVGFLNKSWQGKNNDLWEKFSVAGLLGQVNLHSRPFFSIMLQH